MPPRSHLHHCCSSFVVFPFLVLTVDLLLLVECLFLSSHRRHNEVMQQAVGSRQTSKKAEGQTSSMMGYVPILRHSYTRAIQKP